MFAAELYDELYGYILDLQRFEKIPNDNVAKGYVRIE